MIPLQDEKDSTHKKEEARREAAKLAKDED